MKTYDQLIRPCDALAVDILVHVMAIPKKDEMAARELAQAALEAVANAVHRAEERGHQYRLIDRVTLGMSEVVELRHLLAVRG